MVALFEHVVVPVDSVADARATCTRLRDHVGEHALTVVHVIEHEAGGLSRTPLDAREADAEALVEAVEAEFGNLLRSAEVAYHEDVAEGILSVADERDATAIAFSPHDEGRLARWLSGDVALRLMTEAVVPVIALPRDGG